MKELTFGVEEEYILVDRTSRLATPLADDLVPFLKTYGFPRRHRREFYLNQIEMVTKPPLTDLYEMHEQLLENRVRASTAARQVGAELMAVGLPIFEGRRRPTARTSARNQPMIDWFGEQTRIAANSGMHIHVGVEGNDLAAQVTSRLRPWLPILQSLMVNSPFYEGMDTGFASWRHHILSSWPCNGCPPIMKNHADYERAVGRMLEAKVSLYESNVYWYARPSRKYPTVEIRVGDVCLNAADAACVAGLCRALVASLVEEIESGVEETPLVESMVPFAFWRAAHDGLSGEGVDLFTGQATSALLLLDDLVAKSAKHLKRWGDLKFVTDHLSRFASEGDGAARQRRAYAETGDFRTLIDYVIAETIRKV